MTEDVRAFAGKTAPAVPPAAGQDVEAGPVPAPARAQQEAATKAPAEQEVAPGPWLPLVVEVPPLPDFSRWGPVQQVPLKSVRRTTARQMSLAWAQIPHVMHQPGCGRYYRAGDVPSSALRRSRAARREAEPYGPGTAGSGRGAGYPCKAGQCRIGQVL